MGFEIKRFEELSTTELYEILRLRVAVFVVEQDCAYQDLDDNDQDAMHIFCRDGAGRISAYLRLFWKDHDETGGTVQIGRVVTLERGKGLGGLTLREGMRVAKENLHANRIFLEAQEYATGFYTREGFKVVSEPFLEDGIPHVKMELEL